MGNLNTWKLGKLLQLTLSCRGYRDLVRMRARETDKHLLVFIHTNVRS